MQRKLLPSLYRLLASLMTKLRGHICIRRKAKDGADGAAGKSIRTTVWETGKQYYAGDTQVDGVYPLDIVSDKAMAIGTSGVNFYMCKVSHTSSSNIPLTNTSYWTKLNSLKPVVTYLILAEMIKASFIDVDDLVTNSALVQKLIADSAFITNLATDSAFIQQLEVQHLSGADGDFSGEITAESGKITGNLEIGSSGSIYSSNTSGSFWRTQTISITAESIQCTSKSSASASVSYNTKINGNGIEVSNQYGNKTILSDSTLTHEYQGDVEYALFTNGNYRLKVVAQLPSSPDSYTIYIVTGTQKGVYLGSNQIA